ncbi:HMA2 domain-containing protein [Thioflexithrix psekupsensis]|uniref:Cation transporter n=1 Tax=Thioflexithrix psekupsensis TaxID=1570016 RepID=A0A251XA19_9GAMM|nr:hypothetical protein [Thioflexithrix psekupsensis]OUD15029.1 hypothetical protein TPSD3_04850 [Thioflexithrix psekupsensis]
MTTYFHVVHHIHGRIRLRLSPSVLQHPIAKQADTLVQRVRSIRGILDVRINLVVGSIVIEYDPDWIAPQLWEQWIKEYEPQLDVNGLIERWQASLAVRDVVLSS